MRRHYVNTQLFLRRIIVLLLLFQFGLLKTFSQESSELLKTHIENKLNQIDELILEKNFDLAITKINDLESYSTYLSSKFNRLTLGLKKAKSYYGVENDEVAVKLLLDGLEDLEDDRSLSSLKVEYLNFLGKTFNDARNFSRSREYFILSLEGSGAINDTINILYSLRQIGLTYYREGNLDSAKYYSIKATQYPINKLTSDEISKSYNNLSVFSLDLDSVQRAEEYGKKSLDIRKQQGDTVAIAIALMNLSNVSYKKEEYEKVKENYLNAYRSVEHIKNKRASTLKEKLLHNLAYVNEELRNYQEAYKYLEQATNLKDSLNEVNRVQNISEIEAKYNVAKEAQKAEEEKRKRSQAQALFYGTALVFIAILALGYIFYRNYRLKQQNKLEQIENQTQTKIINATIDAKEKERKAIAETLHDSVSALLSSANLHLQATKAQLKKGTPFEVTKAQTIVNEASVKIRDLSHELISSVLLKFGLAFAVHDMCQKYSNSEITLHSDDDGIKRYHQDFEIKIHNIIEELVNNILKHSKASNATIMLAHKENDMLSVRISDDGVGFNPKTVKGKDGLGLSHIEARIKVMKGVFNIISSKDNGTNIFLLVPIQYKEKSA